MPDALKNVYWIGGGSGAGKSTVASLLAARSELTVYRTDETIRDHAAQCSSADAPLLQRFLAMDMDERWVKRSPREMTATFPWFHGEGFHFIIRDLRRLAADGGVIAEGFRLLPDLVARHLPDPAHAVWLLPSPAFRRAAFERRGAPIDTGRTSDPERALANLLARDELFTERLRLEVARRGLSAIEVDTATDLVSLADLVAEQFGS